ncbi:MAG: hypothetical protein NTU53_20820 [Planctomycetota bacterium]|nr:hypothetical protein [Planctomycetota bacterium]
MAISHATSAMMLTAASRRITGFMGILPKGVTGWNISQAAAQGMLASHEGAVHI